MITVYTAREGKNLRNFVKSDKRCDECVIFPEYSLDANEQASYIVNHPNHDFIVTLSPFIISDADVVIVIDADEEYSPVKFGESINKITMNIWRGCTIGDKARLKIAEIKELDLSEDEKINILYKTVGDSLERILLIKKILG